jgi:hypothetical protein
VPPPLTLQNVIAFIWDFDKTLTPSYMQKPLFDRFDIDEGTFWYEVNSLVDFYAKFDLQVSKDTAYLEHTLQYVRDGRMPGLTNDMLLELGRPGAPQPRHARTYAAH